MVSAGNTGAAMASALLRIGRLHGVSRPAIATADPGAGLVADGIDRRRRQCGLHGPDARAVRPDGLGAGLGAVRDQPTRALGSCPLAKRPPRATRW